MYLSCYQLILRKQCWTLIKTKGLPEELEALVKDLWGLWLPILFEDLSKELKADSNEVPQLISSQQLEEDAATSEHEVQKPKRKVYPTMVDSLALCYMSAMMLRVSISVADLTR